MLFVYFQSQVAEATGFFYATEIRDGKGMNIFLADDRSRFSCTQFGDAILFDTAIRRVVDEPEKSFTWIFQAWLRAMSRRFPVSRIADQDKDIQHSIFQVFSCNTSSIF